MVLISSPCKEKSSTVPTGTRHEDSRTRYLVSRSATFLGPLWAVDGRGTFLILDHLLCRQTKGNRLLFRKSPCSWREDHSCGRLGAVIETRQKDQNGGQITLQNGKGGRVPCGADLQLDTTLVTLRPRPCPAPPAIPLNTSLVQNHS